jgi:hypothetical protein
MPSCFVRYRVVIASRGPFGVDPAHGVAGTALVDEEWEPDDQGDPGRCVRCRPCYSYAVTIVGLPRPRLGPLGLLAHHGGQD